MSLSSFDYDMGKAFLYSVDFCYTGLQSLWAIDYTGYLFDACAWLKDNNYSLTYEILLYFTYSAAGFSLCTSIFFDNYIRDWLFIFEVSEDTLRRYIASLDPTLFAIYHPEYGYFKRTGNSNFLSQFGADIHFFISDNLQAYSLVDPLMYVSQLFCLVYFIGLFIGIFCTFFTSINVEEGAADVEHAINSLSVEAEKELFAADDAKYLLFIFVMSFGLYFGLVAIVFSPATSNSTFFAGFTPFLIICVLSIPCSLLLDFGVLFLLYLRGSSNTNSLFFELIYDYIGVTAFFTRLIVQFVRMVLMFVVYCMMHDAVILQQIAHWFLPVGDSFYEELMALRFTSKSLSYFFLITFPCRLSYWTYEVVHTFFVVTAQFAAFFTIAFWLFFLFYTFYIYEKFEHHFKNLRETHKKIDEEMGKFFFNRKNK